ncbi:MAG: hypothetical protein ACTSQF_01840 [Candidatus Heimdallarchaeaceae archaeon]
MEAGEFESRQAFEEVTTRNVRTVVDYSTATRDLQRELEEKVVLLEGQLRLQSSTIEDLKKLIANLQVKIFNGGTV